MIKAVIFDFFGVISADDYWQFVKVDKQVDSEYSDMVDAVNLGKLSWSALVNKTASNTGQARETIIKLFESQKIDPAMLGLVAELHRNYKTALLTNANEENFKPIMEKAGLGNFFDEIVISSSVGIVKPDSRIFQYTLEQLGVKPEEAVFIDDIARYVAAAQQLGIHAIQFQNIEQLQTALKAILV